MDHTNQEDQINNSIKTLEHYAVFLTREMMVLMEHYNTQVTAIKIGILPEDMMEKANTMLWDIKRLMKHYQDQLEATLEAIGGDFSAETVIQSIKADELKKARSMIKLAKAAKNEN